MTTDRQGNRFILEALNGGDSFLRYVITFLLMIVFGLLGALPAAALMAMRGVITELSAESLGVGSAAFLALNLLPFATMVIALWIGLRYLHRRRFRTLVTFRPRIDLRRIACGAAVWFVLTALMECVTYALAPASYAFSFNAHEFFPVLAVALVLLPLQTSWEELVFRGYLMQGTGLWTESGWGALLITSTVFGLLHVANPEVGTYGLQWTLPTYIGTGLLLGLVTLLDESLELALGVHAANNLYAALIVTFPGSALQTPALFTITGFNAPLSMILWFITAGLFLLIMARFYRWGDAAARLGPIAVRRAATEEGERKVEEEMF